MRAAMILRPAASNRARMRPIAFFFTASGLMMERVRSTDIPRFSRNVAKNQPEILSRPTYGLRKNNGLAPFRDHSDRIGGRLIVRIDAQSRRPHQIVAAKQQRQPVALPRRHARFLEQVLQSAARPPPIGLEPFASRAQSHGDAALPELARSEERRVGKECRAGG